MSVVVLNKIFEIYVRFGIYVSLYSVFGELYILGFIYLINCFDIFILECEFKLIN